MRDASPDELALAAEFPAATREQWRALVDKALKGADFEKRLVSRTYDGLRIEPLYAGRRDLAPIAGRAPAAPWQVTARVDHPDPAAANVEALHELENGATGLSLVFAGASGANGFGLPASADAIARVLDGVYLDAGIAIELDLGPQSLDAPEHIAALVKRGDVPAALTAIRFGLDPIGEMAAHGGARHPWSALAPVLARRAGELASLGFTGPFVAADGRIVHAAGGSEAQELAFVIASAVACLRALEASGMPLDAARRAIAFRMAADADQFLTMAKFRALRRLWGRIEEACGLAPAPAFIAAETAWRMMTRRDPYVNMLRTTIAAFAAGLGGADAITVLPFTTALGLPDRFARRVARNTQLLLLEESNLARVADPAAGSGGIEDLTEKLAHQAWALFQQIEKAGGIAAALEQGLVQRKVAEVRAARQAAVARRKDAITGTSDFPLLSEADIATLDVPPPPPASPPPFAIRFEPLPAIRLAEPFEALRDASDAMLKRSGARPKIFLANLGPLSAFTERATYAKNFFEAGGIEAVAYSPPREGEGEGCAALAAAFRSSGARIACLCSSDKVYADEAAEAAEALTAAGAKHVYLAGRPGERETEWRAAGVGTFIYVGCDVLATLQAAHDMMETN